MCIRDRGVSALQFDRGRITGRRNLQRQKGWYVTSILDKKYHPEAHGDGNSEEKYPINKYLFEMVRARAIPASRAKYRFKSEG